VTSQKAPVSSVGRDGMSTASDGLRFIGRALLWPLRAVMIAMWITGMVLFIAVSMVGAACYALVRE